MNEDIIDAFLQEMRENHEEEIDSVSLPDGTADYVRRKMEAGDVETLLFMLRLGYLMGLQTGFAAGRSGEDFASGLTGSGPLQA
ncbi:MAG: hypothetical protein WD314_08090 [Trueperaceae bacterium]